MSWLFMGFNMVPLVYVAYWNASYTGEDLTLDDVAVRNRTLASGKTMKEAADAMTKNRMARRRRRLRRSFFTCVVVPAVCCCLFLCTWLCVCGCACCSKTFLSFLFSFFFLRRRYLSSLAVLVAYGFIVMALAEDGEEKLGWVTNGAVIVLDLVTFLMYADHVHRSVCC